MTVTAPSAKATFTSDLPTAPVTLRCDCCSESIPDHEPVTFDKEDWQATRRRGWEAIARNVTKCIRCFDPFPQTATHIEEGKAGLGFAGLMTWEPRFRVQVCEGCGRWMFSHYAMRVCCSDRCYQRRARAKKAGVTDAVSNKHHARTFADTTCNACGNAFTPRRADSRYCSSRCRQHAYRQRKNVVVDS